MIDAAFWRGRRVVLTGHTGFKGAWLARWLTDLGAVVTGASLDPPTTPSLFVAAGIGSLVVDRRCDIRQADAIRRVVADANPEIVFHLAAQPLVRLGYEQPLDTFSTNVLGTANVLDACRSLPALKAVVCITTDKCYENREWVWGYREDDRLGGRDPYSASKAAAEIVANAYRQSYFPPGQGRAVATARAGNVIGGGDWGLDRLVPDAMKAFAAGRPLAVRNPGSLRPWQHVLEPLAGYLVLAQACATDPDRYAAAWNFGPADSDTVDVGTVVTLLCTAWGDGAAWTTDTPASQAPHEAGRLQLDTNKARVALGWSPRWRLSRAIDETVTWYRAFHDGASVEALRDLMTSQIASYSAQDMSG